MSRGPADPSDYFDAVREEADADAAARVELERDSPEYRDEMLREEGQRQADNRRNGWE